MPENWFDSAAKRLWAAGLVLGIVLLCIYWPVLTYHYLYYDDWILFTGHDVGCGASPMSHWSKISGRWLDGYVLCGLFHLFHRTEDAWRSRLLIVAGIIAFAVLQWMYFRAVGIRWMTAVCLAFGTSVLPGMLVFGYWITAGSIIFALLASTTAALLTQAAIDSEGNLARKMALIGGACALQVMALLIYQTEAMYFWTLTAVMLAVRLSKGLRAAIRPLAAHTFVGAVPIAGYFIWFRLSGLASELQRADPVHGAMLSSLSDKAQSFLEEILPRASSLWFFDLPRGFGVVVLAVFAVCIIWPVARLWRMSLRQGDRAGSLLYAAYPVVIVALGLMSFSPMLVTVYDSQPFRSMVPLSALILLTGAIHLGMIVRAEAWPQSIKIGVATGFALGLSCLAAGSLVSRMILPAAAEYSFVRNSLVEAARTGHAPGKVHAIVPLGRRELFTDELNGLSAQSGQVLAPMIQTMGREAGLRLGPASFSLPGEPFHREGTLILDFAELSKSGLWKSLRTEGATDSHTRGLINQGGYRVLVYQGSIYGVPMSLGPVKLEDGTFRRLPGVITGTTVSEVLSRLPQEPAQDSVPRLLSSHKEYNLVAFRGRIYGVPWSAGRLELSDWTSGRVEKLPGVVTGGSVAEVLSRLPK